MQEGTILPLVIIGSSTGGPQVLEEIFSRVRAVPAAIIIVQHLAPPFVPQLALQVHQACGMPVVIPEEGEQVRRGTVYLAPSGRHLVLRKNRFISFSNAEKVNGVRPSIDIAMLSLIPAPGNRFMGIILTGMGEDGAQGIAHIKKLGGVTIVQSPETCAIRSMPRAAIATMSVDYSEPPGAIPGMITTFAAKNSR